MQLLPKGSDALEAAYQGALERIEAQKTGFAYLAKQVLSWLVCAKRELTIEELRHALAIELDATDLDEENMVEADEIVSCCAGLVTLNRTTDVVHLVHYTTQEYFELTLLRWAPHAEYDITKACLTYLSFHSLVASMSEDILQRTQGLQSRFQDHVLLPYAANYWIQHAQRGWNDEIEQQILEFLENSQRVSSCIEVIFWQQNYGVRVGRKVTALHMSAFLGLDTVTSTLLKDGHEPTLKDTDGCTPLFYTIYPYPGASKKGQETVVKLLLKNTDMTVNAVTEYLGSPLHLAARYGRKDITMLLLNQDGVQVNATDRRGDTPLIVAFCYGNQDIVRLLLSRKDVNVNHQSRLQDTALFNATYKGLEDAFGLLLGREDLNVNHPDAQTCTILMDLAYWGDEARVRLLLQRNDVFINSQDKDGETALMKAAGQGHEAIVKLLLCSDKVPTDNSPKCHPIIPIETAPLPQSNVIGSVSSDDPRHRMQINLKDINNRTALMHAAQHGQAAIVTVLLREGDIEIGCRDHNNRTALMIAYIYKHEDVVSILEDARAPGEIPDLSQRNYD